MRDLHPAEIYDRGERAYVAYVTGGGMAEKSKPVTPATPAPKPAARRERKQRRSECGA